MAHPHKPKRPAAEKEASQQGPAPSASAPPEHEQAAASEPSREDELLRQLQRAHADFDNYRQRAHASASLLKELIPVCDHLELALAHAREQAGGTQLLEGIAMVHAQLAALLKDRGVEEMPTEGKFDPQLHEAILTVEDKSKDNGTILTTFQRGYTLAGRVLRPARVSVIRNA